MSTDKTAKIEILDLKDYKKAARTLYTAFDDDDVDRFCIRHLEGNPELKKKCSLLLYEAYTYALLLKGMVVAVKGEDHENKDTFETVAAWATPKTGELEDYVTLVRSGFARLAWMTGAEGRKRIFKVLFNTLHDNCTDIMKDDPNRDNMYSLVYLGSTPAARGKGNVRAMFDYMFKHYIDPEQSLAYLESSALRNIPIYEHFGFRTVSDEWLIFDENDLDDRARMDVMIRGPGGSEWQYLDSVRKRRGYEIPKESTKQ